MVFYAGSEIFPTVNTVVSASTTGGFIAITSITGRTPYVTGFTLSALGGSSYSPVTLSGLADLNGSTHTLTYENINAGSAPFVVNFTTPLPGLESSAITLTANANTSATTTVYGIYGFYI